LGVSLGKIGVDLMKIPTNPADIEEALFDQVSLSSLLLGRGLMMR